VSYQFEETKFYFNNILNILKLMWLLNAQALYTPPRKEYCAIKIEAQEKRQTKLRFLKSAKVTHCPTKEKKSAQELFH